MPMKKTLVFSSIHILNNLSNNVYILDCRPIKTDVISFFNQNILSVENNFAHKLDQITICENILPFLLIKVPFNSIKLRKKETTTTNQKKNYILPYLITYSSYLI